VCHQSGLNGSPKFGDQAAWAARIKEGQATLYQHALKGYKGMPAHGACPTPTCSDADIEAAVDYMINKAK
jgi:cytochrome c5